MTRRLHLLGRGNANEGEHQGERHADGIASGQTGTRKLGAVPSTPSFRAPVWPLATPFA